MRKNWVVLEKLAPIGKLHNGIEIKENGHRNVVELSRKHTKTKHIDSFKKSYRLLRYQRDTGVSGLVLNLSPAVEF